MFDFSPSPEQRTILAKTDEIMREHIYPAEPEFAEGSGFPEERMRQLQARGKAAGLWAAHLPRAAGGVGMGVVPPGLLNQQLGRRPLAPRAFRTHAPGSRNPEILWAGRTPGRE